MIQSAQYDAFRIQDSHHHKISQNSGRTEEEDGKVKRTEGAFQAGQTPGFRYGKKVLYRKRSCYN